MCRTDNQAREAVLAWVHHMILFRDNNSGEDSDIERSFKQPFKIKTLGDLDYFVGMKIEIFGTLYIIPTGYIQKVLE